jgi:hypothetical protein
VAAAVLYDGHLSSGLVPRGICQPSVQASSACTFRLPPNVIPTKVCVEALAYCLAACEHAQHRRLNCLLLRGYIPCSRGVHRVRYVTRQPAAGTTCCLFFPAYFLANLSACNAISICHACKMSIRHSSACSRRTRNMLVTSLVVLFVSDERSCHHCALLYFASRDTRSRDIIGHEMSRPKQLVMSQQLLTAETVETVAKVGQPACAETKCLTMRLHAAQSWLALPVGVASASHVLVPSATCGMHTEVTSPSPR